MADTTGHTIELPIKSNFREGLEVLEYFMSAHGARKGMSDTALRTADSGYLTRRMVDVSQELIVRETDCCENRPEISGMYVKGFMDGKEEIENLQERITGRFACETITNKDGEVLVKANHMITPRRAARIMSEGVSKTGGPIEEVKIRTILTCKCKVGVCAKCYGANMATGEAVQVGEAVGIIAAQSIGEPGTQLTMRTFHSGGVAGGDITQGLPRVEELFEARKPKGLAIITEIPGVAVINDTKKKREIIVTNPENGDSKTYLIPYGSRIKIADGQVLEAGDELTEGSVNPHDILRIKGVRAVQDYMIREVQRVYRLQGVEISDKHIEVLVRQMLKKIRIEDNGDTEFLPGTLVDVLEFEEKVCPTCGSCSGMYTANSMNCLTEALGMGLRGNGTIPAVYSERIKLAKHAGMAVMDMVNKGITARDIITKDSIMNALTVDMALGCSTNSMLHLPAIAHEIGFDFDIKLLIQ